MTATPATAALAPVSAVQTVLAKKGVTVADVIRAVQTPDSPGTDNLPVETSTVPLPKKVTTGDDVRTALTLAPSLLAAVRIVNTPRALTPTEQEAHGKLLDAVKTIKSWVKTIEEDLAKPTWFNHFDALAVKAGQGDAPREKHGWLLTKAEAIINGLGVKPTREPSSASVQIGAPGLKEAFVAGEITHQDYLAMTESVRVTNDHAVLAWLGKHPEKAGVIAKYAKVTRAASASLTLR